MKKLIAIKSCFVHKWQDIDVLMNSSLYNRGVVVVRRAVHLAAIYAFYF